MYSKVPLGFRIRITNNCNSFKKAIYSTNHIHFDSKEKQYYIEAQDTGSIGSMDTLVTICGTDTIQKIFTIALPQIKVHFTGIYDMQSGADFFSDDHQISVSIDGLSSADQKRNSLAFNKAKFTYYSGDTIAQTYEVDNSGLKPMLAKIKKEYKPGDNMAIWEINVFINQREYRFRDRYFNFVLK